MSVTIGTCSTCAGTAQVPNPGFPGSYACGYCNGTGVMKKRSYGGYRNAATAATALRNGHGVPCNECDGTGSKFYPEFNRCYACDEGRVVVEAHAGDTLPESVGRSHSIPKGVAAVLANEMTFSLMVENRPGTFAEAYLGLGAIVSVTDYGRAFDALQADREAEEMALIEKAREELLSCQWAKIVRADTREIVERLLIDVHHNGWSLISAATVESSLHQALPPTYTPAVLNRPVS